MIRKSSRQLSSGDYLNITKHLPSTNPIRSPTPDTYSRKERITSTQSPGPLLTDRTNNPKTKRQSVDIYSASKSIKFDFEKQINLKDQQISALIEENKRLQKLLKENSKFDNENTQQKENSINDLHLFKQENKRLRIEIDSLTKQMQDRLRKSQISDNSDEKIKNLAEELIRSNKSLQKLSKELEDNKKNQVTLEDFVKLKEILEIKLKELDEYKLKCQYMESHLPHNEDVLKFKDALESKIRENQLLIQENQKLLFDKKQFDDGKSPERTIYVQREETVKKAQFDDYENKLRLLLEEITKLNDVLKLKIEENDNLRKEIEEKKFNDGEKLNLIKKINELEERLVLLVQEVERLNFTIKSKNNEIDSKINDINILKSNNQKLEIVLLESQKVNERLDSDFHRKSITEIEQLKLSKIDFENENIKLRQLLGIKIQENEELAYKLKQVLQKKEEEISRFHQEHIKKASLIDANNENLILELNEKSKIISDLNQQLLNKEYLIQDFQKEKQIIESENYQIKKNINQLVNDLELWKAKYSAIVEPHGGWEKRIKEIEDDYKRVEAEKMAILNDRKELYERLDSKEREIKNIESEYKSKINNLENERLNLISEKKTLIENLSRLENEKKSLGRRTSDSDMKIKTLVTEYENLKLRLIDNEKLLIDKKLLEQALLEKTTNLSYFQEEVSKLKSLLDVKEDEISKIRYKLSEIESKKDKELNQLKENIMGTVIRVENEARKINALQSEKELLTQTIDSLTNEKAELRRRILELESKVYSLTNDNEKHKKTMEDMTNKLSISASNVEILKQNIMEKEKERQYLIDLKEKECLQLREQLNKIEHKKIEEIKKARDSLTESQIRHEHEKRKNASFSAEKEVLANSLEGIRREKEDFRLKLIEREREIAIMKTETHKNLEKIDELLCLNVLLSANLETLNEISKEKNIKIEILEQEREKVLNDKALQEARMKESIHEIQNKTEKERKRSASFYAEKEVLNKSVDVLNREKVKLEHERQDLLMKLSEFNKINNELNEKNMLITMKFVIISTEMESSRNTLDKFKEVIEKREEEIKKEIENNNIKILETKKKEIETLKNNYENEISRLMIIIKQSEDNSSQMMRRNSKEREDFIQKYEQTMRNTIAKNINEMTKIHQSELASFESKLNDYQETADKYRKELEKLTNQLSSKHDEVEGWREKVAKIENQRIQEIDELKKHLEILKNAVVQQSNVEIQAERIAYETNISQLKNRISEKNMEVETLLTQKSEIYKEIERLKSRIRELEGESIEENNKIKGENLIMKDKLQRLESENRKLITQYKQIQLLCDQQRSESEQNYQMINEIKLENQELLKKIKNNDSVGRKSFSDLSLERCKALEREVREITKSRDDYKAKVESNNEEITEMNSKLINKIQELDHMKLNYQAALSNIHNLEGKLLEKLKEEDVFIS